jgi:hypothetical protein
MNDSAKETIIIVHGTWAAPKTGTRQWYQPFESVPATSGFIAKLDAALQERGCPARCWAHCTQDNQIFQWSGENSWMARTHAASVLADEVTKIIQREEGWRCHLIAHSHGGNIVVEALPQIMASPNSSRGLGKIVTLGTPFMSTISPIRKRAERQAKWLKNIGWGFMWFYGVSIGLWILILLLIGLSRLKVQPAVYVIVVPILVFLVFIIAQRVRRETSSGVHRTVGAIQTEGTLFAMGSPVDEAWQILHHLPIIDNPFAVHSSLFYYLGSSLQSHYLRLAEISRISGARSFKDIETVTKVVAGFLCFIIFNAIGFILVVVILIYRGVPLYDAVPRDLGGDLPHLILFFLQPVFIVLIALVLRPLLGTAFYSAFLSPFRWCAQRVRSLISVGPALATYVVRRSSWPVLLRMTMGLEGYQFKLPPVLQCPNDLSEKFARYENMLKGAEQRALHRRSAWIARHLGNISETFAKLTITAADISSLLRTVEADQTLVHAAYYTDDECIARIADWIAGTDDSRFNVG